MAKKQKKWQKTKLGAVLSGVVIVGLTVALARQPVYRQRSIKRQVNAFFKALGVGRSSGVRKVSDGIFRFVECLRSRSEGPRTGPSFYAGSPRRSTYPHRLSVLENESFVVGYCERRKVPIWVCYRLFAVSDPKTLERPDGFRTDRRTASRITHEDYSRSGYDRGHMAPNYAIATRYGEEAQLDTFLMSNICPQTSDLNGGPWRKLEELMCEFADEFEEVWVITGPIFDQQVRRLKCDVELPDAFYKVVIDEADSNPRALGFIMHQSAPHRSLKRYLVTVDEIELRAGLDFLADLADDVENRLEAAPPRRLW